MSIKTIFSNRKNKVLAGVMATAIAVTSFGAMLAGTLATPNPVNFEENPNIGSATVLTVGEDNFSEGRGGVGTYYMSDNTVASANYADREITVTPVAAGQSSLFYSTAVTNGAPRIDRVDFWVKDLANVAEYTQPNSEVRLKDAVSGETIELAFEIKNGKGESYSKDSIDWISTNNAVIDADFMSYSKGTDRLTIESAGSKGIASLVGTFKDIWGREQYIVFTVAVGVNTGSYVAGPSEDGKYYKPTEAENVYEEVNKNGSSKDPEIYILDPDNSVGKQPPKLTGDEVVVEKITDEMNDEIPPASDFDADKNGYLDPTEKDNWETAKNNAETQGVVKGEDGNYYKKITPPGIWQEVEFGTDGSVVAKEPANYVGDKSDTPDPLVPLYKINAPADTTNSNPSAADYDNTYEGYLTNKPSDVNSEYSKWQKDVAEKANVKVESVTVTPATVTVDKGKTQQFAASVKGTNNPSQTVTWRVSSTKSTISATGLLTVSASETATTLTVTAISSADPTKSSTATVAVRSVTSVTISPTSASVEKGKTKQFSASVKGVNSPSQAVKWTINSTKSTISAAGLLTVAAAETAKTLTVKVTSTADSTKSASATVTVITPITAGKPSAVTTSNPGRTLSKAKSGDTSTWIEIARNGEYSLILRTTAVSSSKQFNSLTAGNNYIGSNAQSLVNDWMKSSLGASANLRNYTVRNTAINNIGSYGKNTDGFSEPTKTLDNGKSTNNIAFLLSYGEAANFCSINWYNGSDYKASPAMARTNWEKLPDRVSDPWWLRSPGSGNTYASHVYHTGNINSNVLTLFSIRPALWVHQSIFN